MDKIEYLLREKEFCMEYFKQHSEQRMKAVHFYVILCAAFVSGYFFLVRFGATGDSWIISVLVWFFTYIFWKLDRRSVFLIKQSESGIIYIESELQRTSPVASDRPHIFTSEAQGTSEERKNSELMPFLLRPLSYSQIFRVMFIGVSIIAFLPLIGVF